jgi:RHS repeat-associated protein
MAILAQFKKTTGDPTLSYFFNDNIDSKRKTLNSSGTVVETFKYTDFGELSEGSTANALFTGKQYDSTGLIYFNARYYDLYLGRFISEDPSKIGTDWYNYCNNNPINNVDPDGRDAGDKSGYIGGTRLSYEQNVAEANARRKRENDSITFWDKAWNFTLNSLEEIGMMLQSSTFYGGCPAIPIMASGPIAFPMGGNKKPTMSTFETRSLIVTPKVDLPNSYYLENYTGTTTMIHGSSYGGEILARNGIITESISGFWITSCEGLAIRSALTVQTTEYYLSQVGAKNVTTQPVPFPILIKSTIPNAAIEKLIDVGSILQISLGNRTTLILTDPSSKSIFNKYITEINVIK